MHTRTGVIGIVAGARDRDGRLRLGYVAGARYIAPRVRVLVDYVGMDIEVDRNPMKWAQVAAAQYRLGADVVFAAGPPTLEPILRAAEAADGRVIGLGTPTSHRSVPEPLRNRLLTMVIKDYERAVYDTLRMLAAGRFTGGYVWYGVGDGVTLLPPVSPRLTAVLEALSTGRIRVPYNQEALDRFLRTLPAGP
jgi:basic membrane protein A